LDYIIFLLSLKAKPNTLKSMKYFWDNIYLTRDERDRLIVLICIFLVLVLAKFFMVSFYEPTFIPVEAHVLDSVEYINLKDIERKNYNSQVDKKVANSNKKRKSDTKFNKSFTKKIDPISFSFNPNTISRDSLELLGISKYAINSLMKYRNKGGTIRSVEQMSRINGLKEETLNRLKSYVVLPIEKKKVYSDTPKKSYTNATNEFKQKKTYKKRQPKVFDINTGDTTDFRNLYGIGKVYSNRIIKYRKSLGGFFSVEQINDVWGIDDSLFLSIKPFLKVDPSLIKKRNINNMDRDSLNRHPYINWAKSKTILAYKQAHGDYKHMNDFYKLHLLEDEFVDTMKFYFVVK